MPRLGRTEEVEPLDRGFSWLQEHLGDDYIAAWFVPELEDAAIINSGMSRWHNYYVEGMRWLVQQIGIDGIYLDDVAFDRTTMKRIKRVLTEGGQPGIIDLRSANQFNMIGYWVSSSPVNPTPHDVPATVYAKSGGALVALASWAEEDVSTTLAIDWAALGLDPARATITAEPIDGFQPARSFPPGEPIPVARGQGWLLTIATR